MATPETPDPGALALAREIIEDPFVPHGEIGRNRVAGETPVSEFTAASFPDDVAIIEAANYVVLHTPPDAEDQDGEHIITILAKEDYAGRLALHNQTLVTYAQEKPTNKLPHALVMDDVSTVSDRAAHVALSTSLAALLEERIAIEDR